MTLDQFVSLAYSVGILAMAIMAVVWWAGR